MNEAKIRERWYGKGHVGIGARVAAKIFSVVVGIRTWFYKVGLLKTHQLKVPVWQLILCKEALTKLEKTMYYI